jgi:drug/metabolite transporter (DMT)-like permease
MLSIRHAGAAYGDLAMKMDSGASVARLVLGLMLIGTVGAAVVATGLDAMTIVFWRSAIGAVFMLVWCLSTGLLPDRSLTLRNLAVGLVAGTSLVLSWAAFFAGIMMTSISTATILFHIQPFLIVVIGAILWRERISGNQLLWLALAFVGVVLASGLTLERGQVDADWTQGIAITLGGAFLYAITAIAGKGLAGQRGEITTLIQTVVGTLIFLPFVNFGQEIAIESWAGW